MNIRGFQPQFDMEMVRDWWLARLPTFPEKLLPPVGIVIQHEGEDIAACWLYMAVGIGVCWIEFPVSKPGLGLTVARQAFETGVAGLEEIAKGHDYGIMIAHTTAVIAQGLKRLGFIVENQQKLTAIKILKEVV